MDHAYRMSRRPYKYVEQIAEAATAVGVAGTELSAMHRLVVQYWTDYSSLQVQRRLLGEPPLAAVFFTCYCVADGYTE